MNETTDVTDALHDAAFEAFEAGRLREASDLFARLLEAHPDRAQYHYMRGLAHKYLRDWPTSLAHNLRSAALRDAPDEGTLWNAGIAATALGDSAEARRSWKACGLGIPDGEGPIEGDFGTVCIRLNPWGRGEVVYAQRIDVVRARLRNIPLPDSGYRFDDVVLHDGAATGRRPFGDGEVTVFNALQRLQRSDFQTFTVFATCASAADVEALMRATGPAVGVAAEDWTHSITHYCLRCSYGAVHRHDLPVSGWQTQRNFGFAAQSRGAVDALLQAWVAASPRTREVEAVEVREHDIPPPKDGHVWWGIGDDDGEA